MFVAVSTPVWQSPAKVAAFSRFGPDTCSTGGRLVRFQIGSATMFLHATPVTRLRMFEPFPSSSGQ